jgi:hypothetical protein
MAAFGLSYGGDGGASASPAAPSDEMAGQYDDAGPEPAVPVPTADGADGGNATFSGNGSAGRRGGGSSRARGGASGGMRPPGRGRSQVVNGSIQFAASAGGDWSQGNGSGAAGDPVESIDDSEMPDVQPQDFSYPSASKPLPPGQSYEETGGMDYDGEMAGQADEVAVLYGAASGTASAQQPVASSRGRAGAGKRKRDDDYVE